MALHLMRPEWLWCLLPAALLALLLWRKRNSSGSWSTVIDAALLPHLVADDSSTGRRNPLPWILLGWCLAVIAASGPSWEKIAQPVHRKQDALVIMLDLSYSMKSGDLAPSRSDRARQKILDLLEQRREGQTALIAYAGDAHIVTPLTDDTPTIANLLPALHPDMMPVQGSDPVAAVEEALALLRSAGIRRGRMLLITDGIEEHEQATIADTLSGSGTTLAVLGVGTSTGAPLPLPRGGFVKDAAGAIVMAPLQDAPLRALADKTGGQYRPIAIDNSDLAALLAEPLVPAAAQEDLALDRGSDQWDDKGYLLLLPLIPLVLVLFRRGWILCLLPLLLLTAPEPANALSWDDLWLTRDQQGQRALQAGDAEAAAQLFENRDWAGTAAFQSGDYEQAAEHFAAGDSADNWYNRGNALARAGKLDEAINAYEEALKRQPGQTDIRDNLGLVKKLLEQQKQEQQQQQDQQGEQGEQGEQDNAQQQQQPGQQQNDSQNGQPSSRDNESQTQNDQNGEREDTDSRPSHDEKDSDQSASQQPSDDSQEKTDTAQPEAADDSQEPGAEADGEALASAAADNEKTEQDQATEQWLRRVPDDPSGLLRQKFRYESQLRQQQGKVKDNENFW